MAYCVLCREDAAEEQPRVSFASTTNCPTCGTYRVEPRAMAMLAPGGDAQESSIRTKLIWAARLASDLGRPLDLAAENLGDIARSVVEPHPPIRKLDRLVLLLGDRSTTFADAVHLNHKNDWPLVFARSSDEYRGLVGALVEDMAFAARVTRGDGQTDLRLTPAGWRHFIQLESERIKSTVAFVAMWFDPRMTPAYSDGFHRALYDLGYDPIRVDREEHLGKIDDFIIASIRRCGLLVADFTGMRTGVFF